MRRSTLAALAVVCTCFTILGCSPSREPARPAVPMVGEIDDGVGVSSAGVASPAKRQGGHTMSETESARPLIRHMVFEVSASSGNTQAVDPVAEIVGLLAAHGWIAEHAGDWQPGDPTTWPGPPAPEETE